MIERPAPTLTLTTPMIVKNAQQRRKAKLETTMSVPISASMPVDPAAEPRESVRAKKNAVQITASRRKSMYRTVLFKGQHDRRYYTRLLLQSGVAVLWDTFSLTSNNHGESVNVTRRTGHPGNVSALNRAFHGSSRPFIFLVALNHCSKYTQPVGLVHVGEHSFFMSVNK